MEEKKQFSQRKKKSNIQKSNWYFFKFIFHYISFRLIERESEKKMEFNLIILMFRSFPFGNFFFKCL